MDNANPLHSEMKDLSEPFIVTFYKPVKGQEQPVAVNGNGHTTGRGLFYPSTEAIPKAFSSLEDFYSKYLWKHREIETKGDIPCFSLTEVFPLERKNDNAKFVHGIVLDIDSAPEIYFPHEVAYALYTSHSHTQKNPRYRIILSFSNPMDVSTPGLREDYQSVVTNVLEFLSEYGFPKLKDRHEGKNIIDQRCLVLTQGYFLPSKPVGSKEEHWNDYQPGILIDPSEFVAGRNTVVQVPLQIEDLPLFDERIKQAKEGLDRMMRKNKADTGCYGSLEGSEGDKRLYTACCLGPDYGISAPEWKSVILGVYNPRCKPEWKPHEIDQKMGSAYRNSNAVKDRHGKCFGWACKLEKKKDDGTNGVHPKSRELELEDLLPGYIPHIPSNCVDTLPVGIFKDCCQVVLEKLCPHSSQGLAMAMMLATFSEMKGKKYHTNEKNRLFCNIYITIVGGPSAFKSTTMKLVAKILRLARPEPGRPCGTRTLKNYSPNSFVSTLAGMPYHSCLFTADEIGAALFKKISEGRASLTEKQVLSELSEFFTSVDVEEYSGTNYSTRPGTKEKVAHILNRPYLSILGGTQPENIYGLVAQESRDTGFTPRWLMVYPNPNAEGAPDLEAEGEHKLEEAFGPDLVETLRAIANYHPETEHPLELAHGAHELTRPMRFSPLAVEELAIVKGEIAALGKSETIVDENILRRAYELTKKIAMIITDGVIVDASHIRWAWDFPVLHSMRGMSALVIKENVDRPAHTTHSDVHRRIEAIVQRGHPLWEEHPLFKGKDKNIPGVTTTRVIQRSLGNKFSAPQIKTVLEDMQESERLRMEEADNPRGKKATLVYNPKAYRAMKKKLGEWE